jgi:hypothetical protein
MYLGTLNLQLHCADRVDLIAALSFVVSQMPLQQVLPAMQELPTPTRRVCHTLPHAAAPCRTPPQPATTRHTPPHHAALSPHSTTLTTLHHTHHTPYSPRPPCAARRAIPCHLAPSPAGDVVT